MMKKIWLVINISLFFAACGGTAETNKVSNATNTTNMNSANTNATNTNPTNKPAVADLSNPKITLTVNGKEMPFDAKFGFYKAEKAIVSGGGKDETAAQYVFRIANFDLEKAKGKQPAGEELMAAFVIVNVPGTDEKTIPGTGDYPAPIFAGEKTPRFGITTKPGIFYIENGKPVEKSLETSKFKGVTKIISATADSISGEINVTDGNLTIKGTFIARRAAK